MYLKSLEIQGFKSFPQKTVLTFENSITAIVGPNGSGKSNIADAILWVTGEQSSKALRGTKMEDVIFGGTEKRSPLGFAQVSLVFDNTSRLFDYDNDEVVITRRYYRSGESEYSVNREPVRLKDIHALLMDTGLGRDGYSIISQGRIAEIVSTRSTDRREVFEEAAGISRFRYRKAEAEDRLKKTEENLLRINDKIDELELQVEPLRAQAETAKKYLSLSEELKVVEISGWMAALDKTRVRSGEIAKEFAQLTEQLDDRKADLEALYASSDNLTERMRRKEEETEAVRAKLDGVTSEISGNEAEAAVLDARIKSCDETLVRLGEDLAEQEKRAGEIRASIAENSEKISELAAEAANIEKSIASNTNVIAGCRMKMGSRESRLAELKADAEEIDSKISAAQSKADVLSDFIKDYEGYSKAVRYVMKETERGVLTGVYGPLAELISTDSECALAIETALGNASQFIAVDTQKTGRLCIEKLKRSDSGRATFLPVDTIAGSALEKLPDDDPGFVGLALDLVSFDEKFYGIVADQLGHTLVAENLTDAVRIAGLYSNRIKTVTLDGQVINPGGSMTGGSVSKNTGVLSRKNMLAELTAQIKSLEKKKSDAAARLGAAQTEYDGLKYQLQVALEESTALSADLSTCNAGRKAHENANSQLSALLESMTGGSEERRKAVERCEEEKQQLIGGLHYKQSFIATLRDKESALRAEIQEITGSRSELEDRRSANGRAVQSLNEEINELERSAAKIEQKKQLSEVEEKQLLDRLWETYELSYTAASAVRKPVENLQKTNREISRLRSEIRALGSVNPGAIEEFARVSERYDFLTGQRDDVQKAARDLKSIIAEITGKMTEIFRERFNEIDAAFRETFLELFGGGKAALVLEDEDNILECGIDIRVQPPGKALSTISLLSGGEMAFVAIALYFAIIKVRPTPFCVMDEIEAALDEANVSRFALYLKKVCADTQFVVITHRRGTMEAADLLFGVTMQEKGVSSVIRLKLNEAEKLQEEHK